MISGMRSNSRTCSALFVTECVLAPGHVYSNRSLATAHMLWLHVYIHTIFALLGSNVSPNGIYEFLTS